MHVCFHLHLQDWSKEEVKRLREEQLQLEEKVSVYPLSV